METFLLYAGVTAGAMFRFTLGPLSGYALKLPFMHSVLLTILGMTLTASIVSLVGKPIKSKLVSFSTKPKLLLTKKNRRKVILWRKYGMWGVAFLTPLILSPPGGAFVAVSFGEKPRKIIFTMFWSGVFWSLVFNGLIYQFGEVITGHLK